MADTAPGARFRPAQFAKQDDLEQTNAALDLVHAEVHQVIERLTIFERALAAVIEDLDALAGVEEEPEDAEQPGEFETEDSFTDANTTFDELDTPDGQAADAMAEAFNEEAE